MGRLRQGNAMNVATIGVADIARLAPVLEPLLAPAVALSTGRMNVADVFELVAKEQARIWLAFEGDELFGAAFGRPVQYAQRKALSIPFIAGTERQRWEAQMLAALEHGARYIGCDLLEGIGRRGFARILPGFRVTGYAFEKDLREASR
jgi:hypothetical protein